ncbi:response regulator transcription factor [Flavobacteriaceae bacterium TP-CH-4]|uniref:Response regulator transcription factor n=2 Tax=Pelagihabitans pacificus TaxID=2696054 RepID=A0A967E5J6_9FLAO|nr:response regulator transcription factor [Pelagihabitans pacificus]
MQLKVISKLVNNHPNLTLEAVYENGVAAREGLQKKEIDLILLDIEMPVIDGFDFLDTLEHRPQIIIISGKSDYALRAFDYDVTDYLHKPILLQRFNTAIQRALANHLHSVGEGTPQDFIFVNSNLQKRKVVIDQIKWIEALGDYVKIITSNGKILVLTTMKAFLERLPNPKFIRIHKSYAVNVEKIDKFSSTYVEIGDEKIPMSRLRKSELEKALAEI